MKKHSCKRNPVLLNNKNKQKKSAHILHCVSDGISHLLGKQQDGFLTFSTRSRRRNTHFFQKKKALNEV